MDKFFTLLELLIVIAIIAILATFLLPALSKAKGMARQIDCVNNLKTMGTSTNMYGNDYNSFYPHAVYINGATSYSWSNQLAPYCTKYTSWEDSRAHLYSATSNPNLKLIAPFICQAQTIKTWRDAAEGLAVYQGNFTVNGDIYKIYNGSSYLESQKNASSIRNPSRNGLLWDGFNPNYVSATANSDLRNIDITSSYCTVGYPHNKRTNVLYADGHVANEKMNPLLPIAHVGNELAE